MPKYCTENGSVYEYTGNGAIVRYNSEGRKIGRLKTKWFGACDLKPSELADWRDRIKKKEADLSTFFSVVASTSFKEDVRVVYAKEGDEYGRLECSSLIKKIMGSETKDGAAKK